MNPPWMLVRLGLETSCHHAAADEDRLAALAIKSFGEYRAFLVRVLGFEAPVEEALVRVRELGLTFLRERSRVSLLRHDLMTLGLSEVQTAQLPRASVTIKTIADALGWMFVLERQTLLAGLVRRQVQQVLGPQAPVGYLAAYGNTPGARFRQFGVQLGELAHVHRPTAIADAANAAFRAQHHWYGAIGERDQLLPTASGHLSASA